MVGIIARLNGHRASIESGRAAFVSVLDDRRVGVEQHPHSWAIIEDYGVCDLSVRLSHVTGAEFPEADQKRLCIFKSPTCPSGHAFYLYSRRKKVRR